MLFFMILVVTAPALRAQKTIYIPEEWDERNIPYSMDRSYESENFIIFWGEKAGTNPIDAPSEISFDPVVTASLLEDIFTWYVEVVEFIPPDHGNFALYKFIIVINETWNPLPDGTEIFTGWAYGGSYEATIGAMWIHPKALNSFTLAHEFTHCMQNMAWIDYPGHGFINHDYVGSFWETHANFMALKKNPDRVENTDPARFLNTQHFYYSSARHHYTNWMFLQYILDTEGMELINRLWRESYIGEHPLETLKRLKGLNQDGLNDLFGSYAMRNVIFDYSNGDEIRYTLQHEIDHRYITRRFTIPELISITNGRYIVPEHLAPQDYGYNIVRLYPDEGNETGLVKVTFRIHENNNAGGGGNRTGFVFVKENGSVRYSQLYRDDFDTQITLESDDSELYMVVTGAPDQHHNYPWEPGFPKIYRFPWEMRIEGARPEGYNYNARDDYKPAAGRIHPNGGGFVAYTASVSPTAFVSKNAAVVGKAVVSDNVRIEDVAIVMEDAVIEDNAVVSGFSIVGGNAIVREKAVISEYAYINNGAVISGEAQVKGSGSVFHSTVSDNAVVKDNASMWGATLSGTIIVGGDAEHFGSCSSGTYLQVYNLGGRDCDGQVSHPLNEDINPPLVPFTDEEMGVSSIDDAEYDTLPYVLKRIGNSDHLNLVAANKGDGAGIISIAVIDAGGRIISLKKFSPSQNCIELQIEIEGLVILRIETSSGVFTEKIIYF